MNTRPPALSVTPVPGLQPTSLGAYLAALGLLRVLSRRWPDVRTAWRDGVLHVVGGPPGLDSLADALVTVADDASWTPYTRLWAVAQKASTKAKSGGKLARWQAEAGEDELELFTAHAAPASRVFFNPLLGSGGNAGKRAFADGWQKATEALKKSSKSKRKGANTDDRRHGLVALLVGEGSAWQSEKLNAASWFSDANKLYNSGQSAFSEGAISPWAMVLACEGLVFFAGGASRRLGAQARAIGAFPFVVAAAAPEMAGEAGRDRGEVWAPLWVRPMTVPEVTALFARGRAEIGGRGARTPAAFAVAITQRGVDAGVSEFRRFALGKTTSANTFEPRYLGAAPVPPGSADARSETFERLLGLIEALPRDRKEGQRWRFVGLRGPLEASLVLAAGSPDEPEVLVAVLDAAVMALDRVDVNRSFRDKGVAWRPLPLGWLPALFGGDKPNIEARLALSLVSAFPVDHPFTSYRFGAERLSARDTRFSHTRVAPARWTWRSHRLSWNIIAALQRSLLDWEKDRERGVLVPRRPIATKILDVESWLNGEVNETLLRRWLSRFALFDWTDVPTSVRSLGSFDNTPMTVNGKLALYGLLHPLFDVRAVTDNGRKGGRDLLAPETGARTPAAARRVAALIRGGDVDGAVKVACSRYAMAGTPLIRMDVPWSVEDPERLLAAMLFPVSDFRRAALVRRWRCPQRQTPEVIHA